MRKLFIITSIAGALLYGGIFAFWGHDWDLSDPLLFILAFPTGKDFINLLGPTTITKAPIGKITNPSNLLHGTPKSWRKCRPITL